MLFLMALVPAVVAVDSGPAKGWKKVAYRT